MKRKICLISEALWPPFDEGMKVFALQLARCLSREFDFLGLTNLGNDIPEYNIRKIGFSKLLVSGQLKKAVRGFSPDCLIYLPQASATTNSFIRAWLLKRTFPALRVIMLGLQPRRHSAAARWFIAKIGPDDLFVQGKASQAYFTQAGLAPRLIPSGVDTEKFRPVSSSQKARLREQYDIGRDVFLLSHVGHLRASRNVEMLKHACRRPRTHMLMIASSFSDPDQTIRESLVADGVDVRGDYVEHLEEVYQMSDAYLFPVLNEYGAIEMPLSVLEALACGIPVICTPFGALRDEFADSPALRFVERAEDLDRAIADLAGGINPAIAREIALRYSWDSVFEKFFLRPLLLQAS